MSQAGVSRANEVAAGGIQLRRRVASAEQTLTEGKRHIGRPSRAHGHRLVPKPGDFLVAALPQKGGHIGDPFQPRPAVARAMHT